MVKLLLYFGIGGAIPIATTTYQLCVSFGLIVDPVTKTLTVKSLEVRHEFSTGTEIEQPDAQYIMCTHPEKFSFREPVY